MQLVVNFRGNDHCNLKLLLPIVFLFRSTRPATCIILYRHVVLQSALSVSYVLGNTAIFGKSLCDQKNSVNSTHISLTCGMAERLHSWVITASVPPIKSTHRSFRLCTVFWKFAFLKYACSRMWEVPGFCKSSQKL